MANPPTPANVKLLCHFDGTDGATSTTDSSLVGRTLVMASGSALSTTQNKFGGSSLKSGVPTQATRMGTNVDSADWDFGSGQFTVEGWIYYTTIPTVSDVWPLACQWASGDFAWFLGSVFGNVAFYYSTTGFDNPNVGVAWTPTVNTWYHMAADRDASNVLRVYIDGVVKASATVSSTFFNSTQTLTIGNDNTGAARAPIGYIDEVRIVKGEAVYGGAFTPPTSAFSLTATQTYQCPFFANPGLLMNR